MLHPIADPFGIGTEGHGLFKVLHERATVIDQHVGIIRFEPVGRSEPSPQYGRQFPQRGAYRFHFTRLDADRNQVRIGKVSVVARLFLVSLSARDLSLIVPASCLLGDFAQQASRAPPLAMLPLRLVRQGPFDGAEAVHVLDFHDGRGLRPFGGGDVQVDVRVNAEAAFLHVAVRHVQVHQEQFELGQESFGLGRRTQVGVRDDFQ